LTFSPNQLPTSQYQSLVARANRKTHLVYQVETCTWSLCWLIRPARRFLPLSITALWSQTYAMMPNFLLGRIEVSNPFPSFLFLRKAHNTSCRGLILRDEMSWQSPRRYPSPNRSILAEDSICGWARNGHDTFLCPVLSYQIPFDRKLMNRAYLSSL
jgi:hypothetical protein